MPSSKTKTELAAIAVSQKRNRARLRHQMDTATIRRTPNATRGSPMANTPPLGPLRRSLFRPASSKKHKRRRPRQRPLAHVCCIRPGVDCTDRFEVRETTCPAASFSMSHKNASRQHAHRVCSGDPHPIDFRRFPSLQESAIRLQPAGRFLPGKTQVAI